MSEDELKQRLGVASFMEKALGVSAIVFAILAYAVFRFEFLGLDKVFAYVFAFVSAAEIATARILGNQMRKAVIEEYKGSN